MTFHTPTAYVRRHVLEWSIPWHVLCLSPLFAWCAYPLSLQWGGHLACEVFAGAVALVATALAMLGRRVGTLFDRLRILAVTVVLLLAGTVLVALPLLGVTVGLPLLVAGLLACGAGAALVFVQWCECMALFPAERVVFTLCLNLVIACLLVWLGDHLDGLGFFVCLLCWVGLGCAGVRRSFEVGRGTAERELGERRDGDRGRRTGPPARRGPRDRASRERGYSWRVLVLLCIVPILCLIVVRSMAQGQVRLSVGWGGAIVPALVLAATVTTDRFTINHLCRLLLVLTIVAVLSAGFLPTWMRSLCVVLCDAAFAGAFVTMAAAGAYVSSLAHKRVCSVAAIAAAALGVSILAGVLASRTLLGLAAGSQAEFVVMAASCVVIVICGIACLVSPQSLDANVSIGAGDASCAPVRPADAPSSADRAPRAGRDAAAGDECDALLAFANAHGLQRRRTEVLQLLLAGMSAGQIARELVIAQGTAKAHIHGIYETLGVHSREELFALVAREEPSLARTALAADGVGQKRPE